MTSIINFIEKTILPHLYGSFHGSVYTMIYGTSINDRNSRLNDLHTFHFMLIICIAECKMLVVRAK